MDLRKRLTAWLACFSLLLVASVSVYWVSAARDDARLIVTTDPELAGPRSEALRTLLYLFDRDQSVRLLNAG